MAQRRMFSMEIVGSDQFLDMPAETRDLYFHLGIYADDDGFVNPKKIIRMVGASDDNLKLLIAKSFVIPFESGVVVITNWKENNYIQKDRYRPTIHQLEYKKLSCIQNVYKMDTQDRLGKDRLELGKDSIGKVIEENIQPLIELFKEVNPSYKELYKNTTERACLTRLVKEHSLEKVADLIRVLPKTNAMDYAPVITTPYKLEKKLGDLLAFIQKEKLKVNNNKIITI